ncbi:methyltransferase domain-containing protein [Chloroflexales bacterium ZM16-3]|nr:methyltransferase domain-containing protein [Chloroflexales bacterium ZM16-3]
MFRTLEIWRRSPAMHAGLWPAGTRSHHKALDTINRELLERANIQPGETVLDAGCGAGSSVVWLTNRMAVSAIGMTIVPDQARRAATLARRGAVPGRAAFLCGDYARSAIADSSVDVVWALESICHAPDKPAMLAEARRAMRPGGRLIIADRMRRRRDETPSGNALLRRWLDGWAMPDLFTPAELAAAAESAGFVDVQVEDVTTLAWPSLRFLGLFAGTSLPAALALRAIGLQSAVQIAGIRGCVDQYRSLRRGLWGYHILTARAG